MSGIDHTVVLPSQVHPQETTSLLPETDAQRLYGHRTIDWQWDEPRTDLPDVTFRHSGWQRVRTRVFRAMMASDVPEARLSRFETCGKHAWVVRSKDDTERYRVASDHCHDRFCMPCASQRSRIIARNVLSTIETKHVRFITLTLRANKQSLVVALNRLNAAFSRLRTSKLWRRGVTGGVAFLEIKRSENYDRWHVHLHALAEGRYMPKEQLSNLWHKITGDSFIVDIRMVKDQNITARYVAKYASKPLDSTVTAHVEHLQEAVNALKGRRLCVTFGSWRGICLTTRIDGEEWEAIAPLGTIIAQADAGVPASMRIMSLLREVKSCQQRGPPTMSSTDETNAGQERFDFADAQSVPSVPPF